jgi:2-haloacid dehalogenase
VTPSTVYIFDAYGTLLDIAAAARRVLAGQSADARLLAEIWRARQLEYAWTDMALGHPSNFWNATTRALDTALALLGLADNANVRESLLAAYAELDAFDDAAPALARIAEHGGRCVTYSNANADMLRRSISAAGLDRWLSAAISVDGAGVYKPDQRAYRYMSQAFDIGDGDAIFVSCNPWDVAGASTAGFQAIWVNRQQIPYPFPAVPLHAEISSLSELP